MKKELIESTAMLKDLREYCSHMRRVVLENIEWASKVGATFVDLDRLDDVLIQTVRNKNAIAKEKAKNARKRSKTSR